MIKRRVVLSFPPELLKEPIIYNLGQQFRVVTNIQLADITEDRGWLLLELEGEEKQIEDGLTWVMTKGVRVDPAA
ncbi:MAG: NIL domain-containing protein [Dehalococcoidales bacterium]|jgi:ABC-type methionine transport system ATPase subunit